MLSATAVQSKHKEHRYEAMGIDMQGLVEERDLQDVVGQPFAYTMISRRSRLHPGMRYIARGLNALASPGNELECEQVCPATPVLCSLITPLWQRQEADGSGSGPLRGMLTLDVDRGSSEPAVHHHGPSGTPCSTVADVLSGQACQQPVLRLDASPTLSLHVSKSACIQSVTMCWPSMKLTRQSAGMISIGTGMQHGCKD